MPTDTTRARAAGSRAQSALARLARAELDNDSFRCEAAAILRRAIGFDWWCWPLVDPGSRLPTRHVGVETAIDRDYRRFSRLLNVLDAGDAPDARTRSKAGPPRAAAATSGATGGDLSRDLLWREMHGPEGAGDVLNVMLAADGLCWGHLHLGRDRPGRWFTEDDERLLAEVAPLIAIRLRDALRGPRLRGGMGGDPGPDPGTIIVDRDLSLVAATDEAWRWVERLGMPRLNDAEPLPGFIYGVASRAAASAETGHAPHTARVRLQTADGHWAVVRAAPLTHGAEPSARGPGAGGGYAITLESARSEDLAPLLMRAWVFTPREREVARLVIDGLATDDIASALFLSRHTVRDHLKAIFTKTGVTRRRDLIAALAGQMPAEPA